MLFMLTLILNESASPQRKKAFSVFDWKSQAVGDRSCICIRQFRNRDCGAVHNSTDSMTDARGARAEACLIPLASPLPEPALAIPSRIGTNDVVSHSRKPLRAHVGKGIRDWISAFSVPPPPPRGIARDSALIPAF